MFFHEVLKSIFSDSGLFNQLFEDLDGETNIQVEIQKQASQISEFDKIYVVSLSEAAMSNFWLQTDNTESVPNALIVKRSAAKCRV